jgi:hypothetical protein
VLDAGGQATLPELAATLAAIAAVAWAAMRASATGADAVRARTAVLVGFVAATAHALMPDTWLGTAGALAVVACVLLWARRRAWDVRTGAALAFGALLSRGALAFTYFPVVGETPAAAKYAHNTAMLALVLAVGVYATGRVRAHGELGEAELRGDHRP